MGDRALIYVRPGRVSVSKQIEECLRFAMKKGWSFAVVPAGAWSEALQLIRDSLATILLMAYPGADDAELVRDVEAAGGRVEYCRPGRPRPDSAVDDMVSRMYEVGVTTDQISRVLRHPISKIRAILDRLGIRKRG